MWGIWSPHNHNHSLVIDSNESDLFLVGYWTSPRLPFVSYCVLNDVHAVLMLMRKLSINMKLKSEDIFNPTEMSSVEEAKSGARGLKINVSMTALDGGFSKWEKGIVRICYLITSSKCFLLGWLTVPCEFTFLWLLKHVCVLNMMNFVRWLTGNSCQCCFLFPGAFPVTTANFCSMTFHPQASIEASGLSRNYTVQKHLHTLK